MNEVNIYGISEYGFNKCQKRELKDLEISYLLQKNKRKQTSTLKNTNIIYDVPVRQDITFKRKSTDFDMKISMQFTEKEL